LEAGEYLEEKQKSFHWATILGRFCKALAADKEK